ncbi:E3 ubiquitin-protein ligase TRIM71-like [Mytilus edulis]|uniref:E3 ubiquitin-protein ligase TRIM71-like n=1 Tax=Mytilus edulis TaxID=6550 RepID=UPI0039EF1568
MACAQHSDENCLLHCKTCNRPVCSDCLIGDHQNHQYSKLDIVYQKNLKVLKDIKSKIELDIPFFEERGENLQHILSEENKQFTENKDKIIQFRDKIIQYADDLLSKLKKFRKLREEKIKKELDSVRQRKDGLEKRKSQLNLTLNSSSALDIFATSRFLDKTMPDKTVDIEEIRYRRFTPGKFSNLHMSHLFGSFNDVLNFQIYT